MARLQSEVGTQTSILSYEASYETCSENFPTCLGLDLVGPKESRKILPNFLQNSSRKFTDELLQVHKAKKMSPERHVNKFCTSTQPPQMLTFGGSCSSLDRQVQMNALWGFLVMQSFARPNRPFTGISGPKIVKKLPKRVFLGLCKKSPRNYPKMSKNSPKSPISSIFCTLSGIFGDVFADPQKDSF